jgi:hypothetical protein
VVNDILDDAIFETVEIINDRYKKIQKWFFGGKE